MPRPLRATGVHAIIEPTPELVARLFADLNDEEQAQVFIELAKITDGWTTNGVKFDQWWHVGRHLATCACSNETARDIIRRMAEGVGEP